MKARTWMLLASAGAAALLYYSGAGRRMVQRANDHIEARRDLRALDDLAEMLDHVVHHDDIPPTRMKQAFELAVEARRHHP